MFLVFRQIYLHSSAEIDFLLNVALYFVFHILRCFVPGLAELKGEGIFFSSYKFAFVTCV